MIKLILFGFLKFLLIGTCFIAAGTLWGIICFYGFAKVHVYLNLDVAAPGYQLALLAVMFLIFARGFFYADRWMRRTTNKYIPLKDFIKDASQED